ncbi:hypothetical protein [Actinophytocola sp.]|jgi:hypothetical protein|uniref:hypothetical protein n=1 Tax=Actinophytocola sp. TaxID=1872138 RepID=UPI002D6037AF|nr:hypothetical protein [Actinophytocola sp.]HYQ66286.1 hypothetical protein [Actinophytocola sp.]
MRNWLRSLRGFHADGRMLGLGLAVAMEKQRQEAAREVENYLRDQACGDVTPASV